MELSCKSEYAILALIELASHFQCGEPLQIRQIAAQQNIPDRYLEQLLATLRRGGLVKSQRGSKGGYLLAREPWKICIFEIIGCLEGLDKVAQNCQEDSKPKTVDSEVVEDIWKEAREASNTVLRKYTLQDLCEKRSALRQLDIMYYI
jgi:Rrf2 family protein